MDFLFDSADSDSQYVRTVARLRCAYTVCHHGPKTQNGLRTSIPLQVSMGYAHLIVSALMHLSCARSHVSGVVGLLLQVNSM